MSVYCFIFHSDFSSLLNNLGSATAAHLTSVYCFILHSDFGSLLNNLGSATAAHQRLHSFCADVARRPVTLSLKDDMTVESVDKRLSGSDDFSLQVSVFPMILASSICS